MPLSDDILPNIHALAEYLYGSANRRTERRVRHLIATGALPVTKHAGRFEGRRSWCDQMYSEPTYTPPNGRDAK